MGIIGGYKGIVLRLGYRGYGIRFRFRFRILNLNFGNYDIEICKGLWFF